MRSLYWELKVLSHYIGYRRNSKSSIFLRWDWWPRSRNSLHTNLLSEKKTIESILIPLLRSEIYLFYLIYLSAVHILWRLSMKIFCLFRALIFDAFKSTTIVCLMFFIKYLTAYYAHRKKMDHFKIVVDIRLLFPKWRLIGMNKYRNDALQDIVWLFLESAFLFVSKSYLNVKDHLFVR